MLPGDAGSAPATPKSLDEQTQSLEDADGKISPLTFPVPSVSPEYVNSMASGVRTVGASISETGNSITGAWSGLRECYTAPESETLYAVLDPVATDGEEVSGAMADAATALETFAEEVEGIKERWSNLRTEAYELRARMAEAGDDWRKAEGGWDRFVGNDSPLVQENADLIDKGVQIIKAYIDIENACATAINGHLAGATRFEKMPEGDAALDPNVFYHGFEQDLSELATEWGVGGAETDHGWWIDAGAAVWDFGAGVVEGTGAMLGAHSSEGWFNQSWGDSLKEYHWDNLTSAASLVGMYDAENDSLGWSGLGSAGEAWKDLAHSVVPWEEWGERPGYVIGTALLNIGSMAAGAALTATGVGAVVGVPLMAWRGAAILDGMGGSDRGSNSGVDLPSMPDMPTFGGAGAPVVNVDTSNFTLAQAAQVTASLDRLNTSTSGGSGGGSSSSESSAGGRPSQPRQSTDPTSGDLAKAEKATYPEPSKREADSGDGSKKSDARKTPTWTSDSKDSVEPNPKKNGSEKEPAYASGRGNNDALIESKKTPTATPNQANADKMGATSSDAHSNNETPDSSKNESRSADPKDRIFTASNQEDGGSRSQSDGQGANADERVFVDRAGGSGGLNNNVNLGPGEGFFDQSGNKVDIGYRDESGTYFHDGRPYVDVPESADALKRYDEIRSSEDSTQKVSANTGFDVEVLNQIKEHLFFREHAGVSVPPEGAQRSGRFAPMDHVGQFWQLAESGRINEPKYAAEAAHFRRLMMHEYVESRLMEKGVPYRDQSVEPWNDEGTYIPTEKHHGAHDLAPLEGNRNNFALWQKWGLPKPDFDISDDLSNLDGVVDIVLDWKGIE